MAQVWREQEHEEEGRNEQRDTSPGLGYLR